MIYFPFLFGQKSTMCMFIFIFTRRYNSLRRAGGLQPPEELFGPPYLQMLGGPFANNVDLG